LESPPERSQIFGINWNFERLFQIEAIEHPGDLGTKTSVPIRRRSSCNALKEKAPPKRSLRQPPGRHQHEDTDRYATALEPRHGEELGVDDVIGAGNPREPSPFA
jgi:hypothetical protein